MHVLCLCGSKTLLANYLHVSTGILMRDPVISWAERDGQLGPLVLASKTPTDTIAVTSYSCLLCGRTYPLEQLIILDVD